MSKGARWSTNRAKLNELCPARNPVRCDLFIGIGGAFSFVLQRRGGGRAAGMAMALIAAAPLQNKEGGNWVGLATDRSPLTGLRGFPAEKA